VSCTLELDADYASPIAGTGLDLQVWCRDAGSFHSSDAVRLDVH